MKKLKKNKSTNFETFLPIFHGFYGSVWDEPDFYGEAEHFGLPEKFEFWQYIKWDEYKEALSKSFCDAVEEHLSDFVERIDYVELDSPKYYNFTNDKIVCVIRPKKDAIRTFIYEHLPEFEKFLSDHFKSRDGFISFYSYSFEDWKKDTKNFKDYSDYQHLGHVLQFISEQIEQDEFLLYEAGNDVFISNYFNEDFDKIVDAFEKLRNKNIEIDFDKADPSFDNLTELIDFINSVEKFVSENYVNVNLLERVKSEFQDNDFEHIISVENIVDCVCGEIESHVLELKFK